jgi:hypothetical protein
MATLLFDLLTEREASDMANVFDIAALIARSARKFVKRDHSKRRAHNTREGRAGRSPARPNPFSESIVKHGEDLEFHPIAGDRPVFYVKAAGTKLVSRRRIPHDQHQGFLRLEHYLGW